MLLFTYEATNEIIKIRKKFLGAIICWFVLHTSQYSKHIFKVVVSCTFNDGLKLPYRIYICLVNKSYQINKHIVKNIIIITKF